MFHGAHAGHVGEPGEHLTGGTQLTVFRHPTGLGNTGAVNAKALDVPISSGNGIGHCTRELGTVLPTVQNVRIPGEV